MHCLNFFYLDEVATCYKIVTNVLLVNVMSYQLSIIASFINQLWKQITKKGQRGVHFYTQVLLTHSC